MDLFKWTALEEDMSGEYDSFFRWSVSPREWFCDKEVPRKIYTPALELIDEFAGKSWKIDLSLGRAVLEKLKRRQEKNYQHYLRMADGKNFWTGVAEEERKRKYDFLAFTEDARGIKSGSIKNDSIKDDGIKDDIKNDNMENLLMNTLLTLPACIVEIISDYYCSPFHLFCFENFDHRYNILVDEVTRKYLVIGTDGAHPLILASDFEYFCSDGSGPCFPSVRKLKDHRKILETTRRYLLSYCRDENH